MATFVGILLSKTPDSRHPYEEHLNRAGGFKGIANSLVYSGRRGHEFMRELHFRDRGNI